MSSSAQTAVTWPILRRGSEGPRVTTLQYLLRCARSLWQDLVPDGVFGPHTESIVQSYQGFAGLTVDGIVGPETWNSLTGNVAFGSMVRQGSTGECVKAAQNELDRHQYPVAIDGVFGPQTNTAVREFQSRVGLSVDGVVGPNTWRELITRNPD
jgi:peptidoglycan hydrolase-like protein with peptidoglycan-binding domain